MRSAIFIMATASAALAIIACFVVVAGLGAGALLHWLIPSIDLGAACICGSIAVGISCLVWTMITVYFVEVMRRQSAIDEDAPVTTDDLVDGIADRVADVLWMNATSPSVANAKPKTSRSRR